MFKNVSQSKEPHNRFTFELHNVDLSIINGIRRVIMTDIPVVGFLGEEIGDTEPSISILANNGPLNNEILLHRFGLIPIHFSEEDTDTFNENEYVFELNSENTGHDMMNVTTKSMKVHKDGKEINATKLFPANSFTKDYILITRLGPQERLHVQGRAIKRTARLHAGFSPVSLCTFSFLAPAAPTASPLDQERGFYKNEYGEPTAVLFSIETEMALSPKYLVAKSLEIMIAKLEALSQTELLPSRSEDFRGAQFTIKNEDDTLGNVLQSNMHNYYIREKHETRNNKTLTYVGYYCPHPLETSVVVRLCLDDAETATDAEYTDVLVDSCARLIIELRGILGEWNNIKQ
jgi:DNA-directed RNA polymerase subunit L